MKTKIEQRRRQARQRCYTGKLFALHAGRALERVSA